MSLSVPQNGVKSDDEPVIELFVKVRPSTRLFEKFFLLSDFDKHTSVHCDESCILRTITGFAWLNPLKLAIRW